LLVENRLLREALSRLCRKSAYLQVVGESGERDLSRQEIIDSKCDVLAIDFFDPEWCPSRFLQVVPECSEVKVLLIGMDGDSTIFLDAVRAGVTGYLLKDASACGVIAAIRSIWKGQAVCPPNLSSTLFQYVGQLSNQAQGQPLPLRPDLTLRQRQLVSMVAWLGHGQAGRMAVPVTLVIAPVPRILSKRNGFS
jgi:DNA-binding NarL/FixJ family response regulator